MLFTETAVTTSTVYSGRLLSVRRDEVRLDNGNIAGREVVEHPGGVAVVAVTNDGKIICERQFRYAAGCELLEIPAGKLEQGEDPLAAIQRELSEETGYTAANWRSLGKMLPTPAYCEEITYLFLATDLTPGDAHLDTNEFLSVCELPLNELIDMIMANDISDAKTIAGILKAERILRD
ncbi:MAG: NUDIX hydrolase [Oscillospiraceae bacterium]|jgi:ADP-ribose pyrophosphatase|nr:NUDIX hydrolase [Oscillospiraceae bacterium]